LKYYRVQERSQGFKWRREMIKKFQGYVPRGEKIEDTFEEGRHLWRTKGFGMFTFKGMKEEKESYPKGFVWRTITIEIKDEEV
jgi:hypothetical protein